MTISEGVLAGNIARGREKRVVGYMHVSFIVDVLKSSRAIDVLVFLSDMHSNSL